MRNRFIRFVVIEEVLLMSTLAYFCSLNPANRSIHLMLLFVFAYGFALAIASFLVYQFNKNVSWRRIDLVEKAMRVAAAMVMTDAAFYATYATIHGLTGLWPASHETPSSIAILAGLCLGAIALYLVICSSNNNDEEVAD